MSEFEQSIVVCIAIFILFLIGLGIVNLLGLGIMKVLDRRTGKKKWWLIRRKESFIGRWYAYELLHKPKIKGYEAKGPFKSVVAAVLATQTKQAGRIIS